MRKIRPPIDGDLVARYQATHTLLEGRYVSRPKAIDNALRRAGQVLAARLEEKPVDDERGPRG